ncbi:T-cell receptor beta chain V region CTL-L17 [Microtus ochrogaster]|nr:T-cell receptor beta chain V region CTL-L17 [Microtus ochrogaster]
MCMCASSSKGLSTEDVKREMRTCKFWMQDDRKPNNGIMVTFPDKQRIKERDAGQELNSYLQSTNPVHRNHTKAGVSQSPTYSIIKKGQNVSFRCDPISGHLVLFWYQQKSGQGPEFLIYFQNELAPDKSGMPGDRFSAERPEGSYSVLKIQPVKQEDSAVYLCSSSLATADHSHLLPAHKPQRPLPLHCCPKPCQALNNDLNLDSKRAKECGISGVLLAREFRK